jgi:hypothetical protein
MLNTKIARLATTARKEPCTVCSPDSRRPQKCFHFRVRPKSTEGLPFSGIVFVFSFLFVSDFLFFVDTVLILSAMKDDCNDVYLRLINES